MTGAEAWTAWAPEAARWSGLAKPVLFSFLDEEPGLEPHLPPEPVLDARVLLPAADEGADLTAHPYRAGAAARGCLVVVDRPGAEAVAWGLALARLGFRPVPLFNSLPGPSGSADYGPPLSRPKRLPHALVDVRPTMAALLAAAPLLAELPLPAEAPPAFLLDWQRDRPTGAKLTGRYDNRAVSLRDDFPSGRALVQAGLGRALLLGQTAHAKWDLLDTLAAWRRAGLTISVGTDAALAPQPWRGFTWRPFVAVSKLLDRAILFRDPRGGYGGTVVSGSG